MGTIRLGRRTNGREPRIAEFAGLCSLDDLVFGAWDIFPARRPRQLQDEGGWLLGEELITHLGHEYYD
jgi:hypothetical protein